MGAIAGSFFLVVMKINAANFAVPVENPRNLTENHLHEINRFSYKKQLSKNLNVTFVDKSCNLLSY